MFPDNVPIQINNLVLLGSDKIYSEMQCGPIDRFQYSSSIGNFTTGRTLHEEFKAKGPNVKVLRTLKCGYPYYEVSKS